MFYKMLKIRENTLTNPSQSFIRASPFRNRNLRGSRALSRQLYRQPPSFKRPVVFYLLRPRIDSYQIVAVSSYFRHKMLISCHECQLPRKILETKVYSYREYGRWEDKKSKENAACKKRLSARGLPWRSPTQVLTSP